MGAARRQGTRWHQAILCWLQVQSAVPQSLKSRTATGLLRSLQLIFSPDAGQLSGSPGSRAQDSLQPGSFQSFPGQQTSPQAGYPYMVQSNMPVSRSLARFSKSWAGQYNLVSLLADVACIHLQAPPQPQWMQPQPSGNSGAHNIVINNSATAGSGRGNDRRRVNHCFHFLLCCVTGGMWSLCWCSACCCGCPSLSDCPCGD